MSAFISSARRRHERRPATIVGTALLVLGALAAGVALWPRTPQAAPLPATFSVAPAADGASGSAAVQRPPTLPANTLSIPSLGISAPLLPGTVTAEGNGRALAIPSNPSLLSLYDGGARACDRQGTVLIAGHVTYKGTRGALWTLSDITPHAPVYITCADGSLTTWEAVSVNVTPQTDLPQDIFTTTGPLRVELITCGGPVTSSGHYSDNVTVELLPTSPPQR